MITINSKNFSFEDKTVVAIGNFDGFHYGHLKLIEQVNLEKDKHYKNYIKNNDIKYNYDENSSIIFDNNQKLLSCPIKSVIFSFYPHPLNYIKNIKMKTILSMEEKIEELRNLGLDYFVCYPFDEETMNISATKFIEEILVKQMNMETVIVGEDFKFGNKQKGDIKLLKKLGQKYNFNVIEIEQKKNMNKKISSTNIRELVEKNNFAEIKKLLGNDYYVKGEVVNGKMLGRTINFPTANIVPNEDKLLPRNGVYVTSVEIDDKKYKSISNVGVNPTTDNYYNKIIETHIFNYNDNLYGKKIKVNFYEFIRVEKKFNSVEQLKEQISLDCDIALKYFEK